MSDWRKRDEWFDQRYHVDRNPSLEHESDVEDDDQPRDRQGSKAPSQIPEAGTLPGTLSFQGHCPAKTEHLEWVSIWVPIRLEARRVSRSNAAAVIPARRLHRQPALFLPSPQAIDARPALGPLAVTFPNGAVATNGTDQLLVFPEFYRDLVQTWKQWRWSSAMAMRKWWGQIPLVHETADTDAGPQPVVEPAGRASGRFPVFLNADPNLHARI